MPTYLTTEALVHLKDNEALCQKIAPFVGMKEYTLNMAIVRNSRSLTTYKSVVAIAESMKKKPETILLEM